VNDPEELFQHGPLERIVSTALRNTIIAHGNITRTEIGSVAKRVATAVRGYLQNFNANTLQAHLLEREKQRLREERVHCQTTIQRLRKQRDDLLEKLKEATAGRE